MTAKERQRYADEYVRMNRKLETKWFPKIKGAIQDKVSSLIVRLRKDGIHSGIEFLHQDTSNKMLADIVMKLYQNVGSVHARSSQRILMQEIGKSEGSYHSKRIGYAQQWIDFIQNYLKAFLLEKITFRINETTRDQLLAVLNEAVQKGWGVDETVNHLQDLPFVGYQAARIVRTEINRAANAGVLAQGVSFEYELQKIWISVRDSRTRGVNPKDHADHFSMDGQTVDFYEHFVDARSGNLLMMPGDPKVGPEDTVNCRCNFATRPKRDENGRLIPKKSNVYVEMPINRNRQTVTI